MTHSKNSSAIGQLVGMTLDVNDLELTKPFWKAVLGAEIKSESANLVVFEPQRGYSGFSLQKVPERKAGKSRAHPDIRVADLDGAIKELKALGATVLRELTWKEYRWVIMADPEGNEFCALP
jgi:predicted enzyme related to lactoylglutathione lyase